MPTLAGASVAHDHGVLVKGHGRTDMPRQEVENRADGKVRRPAVGLTEPVFAMRMSIGFRQGGAEAAVLGQGVSKVPRQCGDPLRCPVFA